MLFRSVFEDSGVGSGKISEHKKVSALESEKVGRIVVLMVKMCKSGQEVTMLLVSLTPHT